MTLEEVNKLAPLALDYFTEKGMQDERIGKVFLGLALTLAGFQFIKMGSSSLLKHTSNAPIHPSQSLKMSKIAVLILGVTVAGFGVYTLASSVIALVKPSEMIVYKSAHPYARSTLKEDSDSCESKLANAIEKFYECPDAAELMTKLNSKGGAQIKCVPSSTIYGEAEVKLVAREVLVSAKTQDHLPILAFELNNLNQAERFLSVNKQACQIGREKYTRLIERIEYKTYERAFKLTDSCISQGYWPPTLYQSVKGFRKEDDVDWSTEEKYLDFQEYAGHSDQYRMSWHDKCDKAGKEAWLIQHRPVLEKRIKLREQQEAKKKSKLRDEL